MALGLTVSLVFFFLGLFGGVALGWLFIGSSLIGLSVSGMPLSFTAGTFYHSLFSEVLMAIGFFVYAGSLISEAGLADRIVRFPMPLLVGYAGHELSPSWRPSFSAL